MMKEIKVPQVLKRELYWFGSIIGRPIDEDSRMNPLSPSGIPIEIEAADHILPSPTMRPAQRIQVYNQQYWWRLLNTLHDIFPLLTRMFGYYDFNRVLGIPYLTQNPPRHWSLNFLGDRIVDWLEKNYHAEDKPLVIDSTKIDLAFSNSFLAAELKPISLEQLPNESALEEGLQKKMYAQPHIQLFKMDHHLFDFRAEFLLQEPEYWLDHDFPKLKKERTYHFALYRNKNHDISWKEIKEGEYHLLAFFKEGMSLDEACEWLEKQDLALYEEAASNLETWFKEWTTRGWLSFDDPLIHGM